MVSLWMLWLMEITSRSFSHHLSQQMAIKPLKSILRDLGKVGILTYLNQWVTIHFLEPTTTTSSMVETIKKVSTKSFQTPRITNKRPSQWTVTQQAWANSPSGLPLPLNVTLQTREDSITLKEAQESILTRSTTATTNLKTSCLELLRKPFSQ